MAIVTGQERKIRGGPEDLSPDAMETAQNAIEAKRKELEEKRKPKPDCEKPIQPPGFKEPVWSTSQRRWACRSEKEDKWQIWDRKEWCDFDIWDKTFATQIPFGHRKPAPSDRQKTFLQSVLSLFGGGK